jgi:hypothetical protein
MFFVSQGAMNWAFFTWTMPPAAAVAFGRRDDEVGLAAQEGRDLDDIDDLGDRFGLAGLMQVSADRYAQLCLHAGQRLQARFHARSAIGFDRGAIRLVEARLEDVRQAQRIADPLQLRADFKGQALIFQHVQARDHGERLACPDGPSGGGVGEDGHGQVSVRVFAAR